ncbi:MAG: hypothetical protein PHT58_06955 [Eubacteriales bacterium]|nr:hypothetical protein [Eubacteriales bacterium]
MEVQFDNDKRGTNVPKTRIYAPTHRKVTIVQLEEDDSPKPVVVPQPTEEDVTVSKAEKKPWPISSMILLLIAMFIVAGTAVFALKGDADITKIYSQISDLDAIIADYEEEISQAINDQGALNDYTSINQANLEAGRTMNWAEEPTNTDEPTSTDEP